MRLFARQSTRAFLAALAGLLALAGLQGSAADKANNTPSPVSAANDPAKRDQPAPTRARLDLNGASKDELKSLPNVGEEKAQAILDHRPYKSARELVTKGVLPAATFRQIRDRVTANPAKAKPVTTKATN